MLAGATAGAAAVGAARPSLAEASTTNPFIVVDPGGGGDYTDVMPAVQATSSGSTIFVRRGTYTITDSLRPAAGVRIVGEGYGTVLRAKDNLGKNLFFIQNDNVVLENLNIDGNRANQQVGKSNVDYQPPGAGGRVLNCWVHDAAGYNIVAYPGVTDLIVSGNRVYGSPQDGIEMQGCSYSTIVGNTCINNGNGIQLWNSTGDCAHVAVVGNTVRGSGNYGILVQDGAHENAVTGNTVDTSGKDGILVGNGGSGTTNPANANIISGNSVTRSGQSGMRLNGVSDTVLTDNLVRSNSLHGIWLRSADGCTIGGNTALGNRGSGIRVEGFSGSPSRNVAIDGNTARNNGQDTSQNGDGIALVGPCNRIAVTGNICYDSQSTKTQRNGISLEDSSSTTDNVLFNGNLVDGNRDLGLAIKSVASRTQNVPFRKVSATIGTSQLAVPHGLSYPPQALTITMRSRGTVWQSAPSDATNVYLTADAASRQVDVIVG